MIGGPSPWGDDDDAKDAIVYRPANARLRLSKKAGRYARIRASAVTSDQGAHRNSKKGSWARMRHFILARDGHQCHYCGEPAYTVDHVHPKSRGGSNGADNLVAACHECNNEKGAKLLSEWRR